MSKNKFTLIINDDNGKISIEMQDYLTETKTEFKIEETTFSITSLAGMCKLVIKEAKEMYREAITK
jgi:C4-type Zn-finger protein